MTDKSKMTIWYVGLAALAISLSYVAYRFEHSTTAILIIIVPAALIANGFLAEFEDNASGGFLSGEGKKEKKQRR